MRRAKGSSAKMLVHLSLFDMSTKPLERLTIEQSAMTFHYSDERMRRMMISVVRDESNLINQSHVSWLLESSEMKRNIEFQWLFKTAVNQLRIGIVCREAKQNKTTIDNRRTTGPFRRTCIAREKTVSCADTKVGDIQSDRPGQRLAGVIRQIANIEDLP